MKTLATSFLVTLALVTGCAQPTGEVDSTEESIGGAVVQQPARATAAERVSHVLTGKSLTVIYVYNEDIKPVDAAVGQPIDINNQAPAHVWGVYNSAGEKVGALNLPEFKTVSFQMLRAGDYQVTCEDCQTLTEAALTAVDWPGFIEVLNAGKAFEPVRTSFALRVRAPR